MIQLSQSKPFARGGRRACYRHPQNPERCIKVALPGKNPSELKSADPWWKRLRSDSYYDENTIDRDIYAALLQGHGISIKQHICEIYGTIETDLGIGLEVQLIRNYDKKIALSGKGYIVENGWTEQAKLAVDQLEAYCLSKGILIRDPFPHNLAMQENSDSSISAIIVDGLSRKPLKAYNGLLHAYYKKRILKKMQRLRAGFARTDYNRKHGIKPKTKGLLLSR